MVGVDLGQHWWFFKHLFKLFAHDGAIFGVFVPLGDDLNHLESVLVVVCEVEVELRRLVYSRLVGFQYFGRLQPVQVVLEWLKGIKLLH